MDNGTVIANNSTLNLIRMKKFWLVCAVVFGLVSCASSLHEDGIQKIWVNSYKIACADDSPIKCYQIQMQDRLEEESWETLHDPIYDFDFTPGTFQQIEIAISQNPETANSSEPFEYTYLKTIQKLPDTSHFLNGEWKLYAMDGVLVNEKFESQNLQTPRLRIDIPKMQISGNASCNRLNGQITHLSEDQIRFGPIMSTKMMCSEMHFEMDYFENLEKITQYLFEQNQLILLDRDNNTLLTFDRVSKKL